MRKRILNLSLAFVLVVMQIPVALAAENNTVRGIVNGGDTITENGTYQVASDASGIISIPADKTVKLIGSGISNAYNTGLTVQCGQGVHLTVRDLCVTNSTDINLLDFTGRNNTFKAEGVNVLESVSYVPSALIHVGPEAELTLEDGGGAVYLYKRTQGSGIGSNAEEANGRITFAGGRYFIKGSKTGAVIGNDTCGDVEKESQIGDITISGGELYIEANARGAAIGGSNLSAAGNVYMTGGKLTIYNDYSASSIGAGQSVLGTAEKNGTFTMTGGSLKLYLTRNGAAAWGTDMGNNDITLRAGKTNGSEAVYKYILDVSGQTAPYSVIVDGNAYYSGEGHDYEFSANTASTVDNWQNRSTDKNLYLYLTPGEHTVSVNGGDPQIIQVEETQYKENEQVQIPEGSWADHADTTWYTGDTNTYTLSTNQELAGLAAIVNAGEDTFKNTTIRLGADIDLSAYEWVPIGSVGQGTMSSGDYYAFQGCFDGNGYEITGLYYYEYNLTGDESKDFRGGLFAYADHAVFRNVTIGSGYIGCVEYAGGIAGEAPGCQFVDCENHMDIAALRKSHGNGWYYGDKSGGICGSGGIRFENCVNYGNLDGNSYLAGICGFGADGNVSLTACVNYGNVTILWDGQAAGIVCTGGSNTNLSVIHCANHGDVTAQIDTASGISGSQSVTGTVIKGCINTGRIGGKNAGGMIGAIGNASGAQHPPYVIVDCYNTGDIQSWQGYRYAGGAGGIVGSVRQSVRNVYISNCYNIGTVICDPDANLNGDKFASGIVGAFFRWNGGGNDVPILYSEAIRQSEWLFLSKYFEKETDQYLILKNNYYLKESAPGAVCGEDIEGTEAVSSGELKNMTGILGSAYVSDSENINGGYPILSWQKGIHASDSYCFKISANVDGSFVQVTDCTGNVLFPESDGKYTSEPGEIYLYKAEAEGYIPAQGVICDLSEDREIIAELSRSNVAKQLILDTDAEDAKIEVFILIAGYGQISSNIYQAAEINEAGNYELIPNKEYKYTITAENHEEITGEFTAGYEDVVIKAYKDEATPKPGDLNGDSKINGKDATRLAKYLAGSITLTAEELTAADVNGDGKVNGKDATRLAKYLAGSISSL